MSSDVQVHAPFDFDGITHSKHYTNLDTVGRYKLTLDKSNVVYEHEQYIQVIMQSTNLQNSEIWLANEACNQF